MNRRAVANVAVAKSTLAGGTHEIIRGWCNFNASHVRIGCVNTSLTKIKLFPQNDMTNAYSRGPSNANSERTIPDGL